MSVKLTTPVSPPEMVRAERVPAVTVVPAGAVVLYGRPGVGGAGVEEVEEDAECPSWVRNGFGEGKTA
jgi:hypothetical protein